MDSLILQTALGLTFVFAVFAAAVSAATEVVSRFLGLRGEYLLRGLRTLLGAGGKLELGRADLLRATHLSPEQLAGSDPNDPGKQLSKPMMVQVMSHPLIAGTANKAAMPPDAGNAKLTRRERQAVPSYISGRTFAAAMIAVLTKPEHADAGAARVTMDNVRTAIRGLAEENLRQLLAAVAEQAGDDVEEFSARLAVWYDDHMARVSGWYKRHVRWISLAIGLALVLLFNLSAIAITQSLYSDQALRESVVTEATAASGCDQKQPVQCLNDMRSQMDTFRGAGLPIGWGAGSGITATKLPMLLLGWLLMTLSLVPGARFWFDSLARLGTLRSTGPKPSSS